MSEPEDDCPITFPSILVDSNILSSTLTPGRNEEKYKLFEETEHLNEYVEFELYAERRSNVMSNFFVGNLSDKEEYCSTPESSMEDEPSLDEDTPLDLVIQKLPTGIIINSNVYLSSHQWHTIKIDDFIGNCVLCNLNFSRNSFTNDVEKHINSDEHKTLLGAVKPLAIFDLSIVRKIRDLYHCGVCNETFDIVEATTHTDSKTHAQNYLSAINKVSDVIEYTQDEKDTAHSHSSYESGDDNNDNNENNNDAEDDEDFVSEWVIATNNNPELSYANKLKLNNDPKEIVIELRNKKFSVAFNCWHMIAVSKSNTIYCMACQDFYKLNSKFQHCESNYHLDNLKKCNVDNRFDEHFIRRVDNLYHCGHCNTLQSQIEEHLEARHLRKSRKISENSSASTQNVSDVTKDIRKVSKNTAYNESVNKDKVNNNSVNRKDTLNNNNANKESITNNSIKNNDNAIASTSTNYTGPRIYYKYTTLDIFRRIISLPLLNYNTIILQNYSVDQFKHFCALCNITWFGSSAIPHTNTIYHIQLMQKTPFIAQFDCNLIRNVNGMFHCGLCNVLCNPLLIHNHIVDPIHGQNFRTCVFFKPESPLTIVDNSFDNLNNDKHDETKESAVSTEVTDDESKLNEVPSEGNDDYEINTSNEEMHDTLNDTIESAIDLNGHVFVKLKNLHLKVTFTSYNTLVPKGDGDRYCFVCSLHVRDDIVKSHVESRSHVKNIDECPFIEGAPLRQMYLIYHCGICNVLIKRTNIKDHLDWPTHIREMEYATKVSKRQRKIEVKNGTPQITMKTDKEKFYEHKQENTEKESKILFAVEIVDKVDVKKFKMIIVGETVLKVAMDSWHGIANKDGLRCIICQREIDDTEAHVRTDEHGLRMQYPFVKKHTGHLLREITRQTFHCIVCNVEVSSLDDVITKHVEGKKHIKNYDTIKKISSESSSYDDCVEDVLQL